MIKKIILFLILLLILICCGNEPPFISFPIYHILIYQSGALGMTKDSIFLSVYFNLDDENGMEDIESLKIIHLDTELAWNIPVENLGRQVIWEEKNYSGYSFLEYNNTQSILTGDYLIEVTDKAGNLSQIGFYVDPLDYDNPETIELPEIKYEAELLNDNKELKISGDIYSSCEIKFLNNGELFNGGRKKYSNGQKLILNDKEPLPANSNLSIRINKDDDEKIVYFLKNLLVR